MNGFQTAFLRQAGKIGARLNRRLPKQGCQSGMPEPKKSSLPQRNEKISAMPGPIDPGVLPFIQSVNLSIHYFRYNSRPSRKQIFRRPFASPRRENLMKPMTALMTAAVFSVLSLNACGGSEKKQDPEQTEARFQLNPHPKQAYRLKSKSTMRRGRWCR